ncbi:MAG: DUF4011 domain-containing protein [Acidobacteriia bacterium]|nr:DUF4011 domain-containing protein [Terriglobia bacterium]
MPSQEDKQDALEAPKISEEFSLGNVHTGLEKIRTRLLDLTARNKLLNFRHPKTSCLRFVDTTLDAVFQHLIEGNTLTVEAVPEPDIGARDSANSFLLIEGSQEDQIPAKDHAIELGWDTDCDLGSLDEPPRMRVLAYQDDLDRTAKKITTTARTSIEESGANMLYLCFAFLEWKDSATVQASHAPLLIMPVTIEREKAPRNQGWVYQIQYSGEDLTTNLSLVEKMKRDFAVSVPHLREEDTPSSYADAVREAISNRPEWQVKNFLTLALLSFGKLLMFLDLDPARWPAKARITNHSVIKNLFEGVKTSSLTFPDEYPIDDEDLQMSVPRLFYDADSSQHSALIDALNGKNLVIEGPPGTGKSQSITNLIASALLKGKSVLFIAEKLAALEVVYRRLDAIGLGLFCLELHSHRTQKRELLNGLERRLSARNTFGGAPNLEYKLSQAKETKTQLNKYVRLLNMPHPQFGSTTFDIIWARHRAAMALPVDVPDLDSLMIRDEERLGRPAYERGKHATDLFTVMTNEMFQKWPVLKEHPWYGVESADIGYAEQSDVLRLVRSGSDLANACADAVSKLRGRGVVLSGTLGDLEWCRSVEGSLPVASPNPTFALLPELYSDSSRRVIGDFCDQVSGWRKIRVQISQLGDLNAAIHGYPSPLRELSSLVDGNDIGELSKLDVDVQATKVNALLDQIPHATALLSWAQCALLPTISGSRQGFGLLREVFKALATAPDEELSYRHSALLHEHSLSVIRLAKEKADDVRARAAKLTERFELSSIPSSEELHSHAANLLDSNFVSRLFRKNCRDAKRAFRRLLKTPRRSRHSDVIAGLRELAEYKGRLGSFNADKRFTEVAGPYYEGINTPWRSLLRVAEWLSSAAQGLGSAGKELLDLLTKMPIADSRALRRQLESRGAEIDAVKTICELSTPTMDALPPSVRCSWDASLEEFCGHLQGIAGKLSNLSRLAGQSGIKDFLKLAHAGMLCDLCRDESLHACEADRLTQELGLAEVFEGPDTNIDAIRQAIDFAADIDAGGLPPSVRRWLLQDFDGNSSLLHVELNCYVDLMSELQQTLLSLTKVASLDVVGFWGCQTIYEIPFAAVAARLNRAIESQDDLPMFVDWLRSWDECSAATLPALPRLVLTNAVTTDGLPRIYEYLFYSSLATSCINAHSDLMLFKGLAHENVRARFASLDREIMSLNAKYAASVLDARSVPMGSRSGPVGQWTDLSLIDHELAKQKRHVPIRQLVNRAGDALKALKPCFMMSPLSVAQYLEPGRLVFDLVVMDEASQLKPEDALGAIARGGQLVVVGDPKQLPPTTFFERVMEDGETTDDDLTAAEDAESILDVATSVYQPIRRLRWHYRSRHQSLIEFSNHEFYKNLVVFPSAYSHHPELGVKLIEVPDGRFVNRRNVAEAQKVVRAAVEHMRVHPQESLGVVALNFEQRELIDDLLDQEIMNDPHAEAFVSEWREKSEPLFVKNLENVQGDERDVIFISTTYGPNEHGKQFQRFGPINGPQGHRRLNVLFTRAKKRVEVFSSLQANNIITDGASWGVKVLRQYLEFAKSGTIPEMPGAGGDPDSDFEISVGYVLKSAGYDIVPQVGVAGFSIDIGVRDSSTPGRFLAGIECDGAAYHSAKSARDRDRLRQEILESHGWRIYRIWSTDWFKNKRHEETRLLQFLSAAQLEAART